MKHTGHSNSSDASHSIWVRISHGIVSLSILALIFTGVEILMVHPRLYWGEVGNDLTPALIELPISRNYKHGGFTEPTRFFETETSPASASRTYDIFNKNGWGRSGHFLAGWFLVIAGLLYFIVGIFSGHFKKHLWLHKSERIMKIWKEDFRNHLIMNIPEATGGPSYGVLQKAAYLVVVFALIPLMILTGMSMAPAITAAFPFLLKLWGMQSARTIHFFCSSALVIFFIAHVFMVIKSGFKKQIQAMTIGK